MRQRPWILPLLRAVLALALGLGITFSSDHSSTVGLLGFGAFATLSGAAILAGALTGAVSPDLRTSFLAQSAVTIAAGVGALVLTGVGLPALIWLVALWAVVTGAIELSSGLRRRRSEVAARDWSLVGAATVLLGVAFLVVPPDFAQSWDADGAASGVLTAEIMLVGILGAWAVVTGVVHGIATVTLRTPVVPASAEASAPSRVTPPAPPVTEP